ncbi:putative entry exclusion protein TrbK-alt [Phenylobacterium sp.]|uniref:putative entry exclusion protein TrbK-alt n=1 Tax=Phenylobacterium sp. TaxID=1871053 RepID=UPI002FCB0A56
MSPLDPLKLARLGALAFAIGAALAAALAVGGKAPPAGVRPAVASTTSLSAELDRCRALGAAAQGDRLCREAWRTSREQFLSVPGGRP